MTEQIYGNIDRISKLLHLELSSTELAELAEKENFSSEAVIAIGKLFTHLEEKKKSSIVTTILKTSRLPLTKPKTFSNFDFSRISGDNVDSLKNIQSLSAVYSHRNLAFIGPAGTGKTHLAQAFGYECCLHGMKCYFIKMSELGEKFSVARRTGTVSKVLTSLVRPSCLIIDEVGHCTFDVENTRLFFDLIDRRYQKEGNYNMVFTSNKNPALWKENFSENDTLLCALDRIFDDATVFKIKGQTYRGKALETIDLRAEKQASV